MVYPCAMRRLAATTSGVLLLIASETAVAQVCEVREREVTLEVSVPASGSDDALHVRLTRMPADLRFTNGEVHVAVASPVVFSGAVDREEAPAATARPLSLLRGMVSVSGNRAINAYKVVEGALVVDLDDGDVSVSGLHVSCGDVALREPTTNELLPPEDQLRGDDWWAPRAEALVLRELPGAGLAVRVRPTSLQRVETAGRWWRVAAGGSTVRIVGWVLRDRLVRGEAGMLHTRSGACIPRADDA